MNKDYFEDNMSDDEIRILSPDNYKKSPQNHNSTEKEKPKNKNKIYFFWIIIFAFICVIGLLYICFFSRGKVSLHKINESPTVSADTLSLEILKDNEETGPAYAILNDTVVNDIPMRVWTPVGGHIEMFLGADPSVDTNVILAAHAADLRDDDGTPAGAFVYKGNLMSKGHSKYGFCAMIDGEVSIGRQVETPLFERAIEKNGSFFRQYSLVTNGNLMSVPPKGKSIRRALCLKDNSFQLYETSTPESYHDFSQALVDIGVTEALALVGGNSAVMWRDEEGNLSCDGGIFGHNYPNENYIIWRR